MAKKFYITTAIDYVNAKPHIGHAFEKVLADAIARYHKLHGEDVFFLTGVDENAQKNVEAAQKAGIPIKEFIDKNTASFVELCKKLNIGYSDFIRTTAKEHAVVVQNILQKLIKKGDVYKGTYEGLYCIGCETYYAESDLVNGKCPEHETAPELRKEEAYFFKLSKYKKELLKIIPEYVVPKFRANEVLTRIKEEGLNDICISRKNAKWGIDFPNDKNFKIWVWIDALINYVSGLKGKENKYWPADAHIVGKGINWFHSVIWPAILISAGYKLPKKLIVHGYLNIAGKKISKTLGNTIDPIQLLNTYPSDIIRYSLLKCSTFNDSDYSEEILTKRNNELADKLGNLVSRVSTLAEKYGLAKTPNKLIKSLNLKPIEKHFENYELDKALNEIFAFIDKCNEYTQNQKPWATYNQKVLYELADSIKAIAILLSPFMPETSEKIAKVFNFEISLKSLKTPLKPTSIKKADILFQKINKPSIPQHNNLPEGIATMSQISFNEFSKVDMRVAKIKKAEDIPNKDKLYKLEIDLGKEKRTIVAGIKQHYTKEELKDKRIIVIANLEPAKLAGIESNGMLLAAVTEDHKKVVLIQPEKDIPLGSRVQ